MREKPCIDSIFCSAIEVESPDERRALVERACGEDADLKHQVSRLIHAHFHGRSILDAPVQSVASVDEPLREVAGSTIGAYKLLEQIGEGGFGLVFMAEQSQPVRRRVALKILKAGMDTSQVIARFEAERQALAIMDHPNIARVFDGGATPSGRPFFVMELVRGMPITEFCDQSQLLPRQRLELFVSVCQAVQHAHQKGIIHRDLKPTNILVTMHDTTPVPKIIDFGIAKALGQDLTEKTLFTAFAQMVGTPMYMSPEQAGQSGLDADTRSDVYSLGVLLYELLTGSTPFGKDRFKTATFEEIRRIIREEEPPKPSTRLMASTETLQTISAQRQTEPAKLTKLVKGELDWIVMKALDKDRNRRYESASAMAADVVRYLHDEPVQACPPSTAYRLRKFTRRNRRTVLAATVILMLLICAITGTTWGLLRAEHARQAEANQRKLAEAAAASEREAKEAEAEQRNRAESALKKAAREAAVAAAINEFLNNDILRLSSPTGQAGGGVSPDANLKLRTVLQHAAKNINGKFPNEPEVEMRLRYTIGFALASVGDHAAALPQFEKSAALARELLGRDNSFTLNAEYRLACMHRNLRHYDIALPLLEENLERHKAVLGSNHRQTFVAMNGLSLTYRSTGQPAKALLLAEENLELRKRHLGPTDIDTLVSMNNVALIYMDLGRVENALRLYEQGLAAMNAKLDPLHPEKLNTTRNLGRAYRAAEQLDKAVPLLEASMRDYKTAYGVDDSAAQVSIDELITCYVDIGLCDKAEALLKSIQTGGDNRPTTTNQDQAARERRHRDLIQCLQPAADKYQQARAAKKEDHPAMLAARQAFAVVLRNQRRTNAAAYHLKHVLDGRQRLMPTNHIGTQMCRLELGTTRLQQKRYADAEPLLLEAYMGLTLLEIQNAETINQSGRALQRLVELYEGWDKNDKADEWRTKFDEQKKQ